jgi:hypothetical protein
MKKISIIVAALTVFALASCRGHRTCPTYMKANFETQVSASLK